MPPDAPHETSTRKKPRRYTGGRVAALLLLASVLGWEPSRSVAIVQLQFLTGLTPPNAGYIPLREGGMSLTIEPEAVVDASDFAGVAGEAGDAEVDAWLACLMAADLQSDDGDASFQAALEHLRSLAPVDPRTWAAVVSGPSGPVQVAVPRADSDSEPTPLKPWHRAALEEAIAQGRAAEPDNGLWDSTGLVLAVVDDDIDSAVRHLERAVAADGYDEHASDLADAVCRASEALGQYPFRARLTALEQARPGRPGASLRVAVRHLAAEVAARHEAHGRHEEALSIYASLLRLNGLVTESPLWEGFGTWRYPPPWVARATWRGRYAATTPDSDSQAHRSVAALREFVSYCVSHGRSDLADKALATSAKGARAAGAASHGTEGWRKVEAPLLTAILGWYLGEGMLALAIVLTLVALGLHLARFLVLRRRTGRATAAALSALLCLAVCTLPAHATIYSGETSPWEAAMPYICAGALLVLLGIAVGWCYLRHPRGPGRLPATLADLSSGAWLLSKVCWTSFALLALTTGGLQAYALHWMLRGSG